MGTPFDLIPLLRGKLGLGLGSGLGLELVLALGLVLGFRVSVRVRVSVRSVRVCVLLHEVINACALRLGQV